MHQQILEIVSLGNIWRTANRYLSSKSTHDQVFNSRWDYSWLRLLPKYLNLNRGYSERSYIYNRLCSNISNLHFETMCFFFSISCSSCSVSRRTFNCGSNELCFLQFPTLLTLYFRLKLFHRYTRSRRTSTYFLILIFWNFSFSLQGDTLFLRFSICKIAFSFSSSDRRKGIIRIQYNDDGITSQIPIFKQHKVKYLISQFSNISYFYLWKMNQLWGCRCRKFFTKFQILTLLTRMFVSNHKNKIAACIGIQ